MRTLADYLDSITDQIDRLRGEDEDREPGGIFRRQLEALEDRVRMLAATWAEKRGVEVSH